MDDDFDVVICGTGLKECIIGGLLSVSGKKILQIDRNPYYGGESASLNLTNLFEKFYPGKPVPSELGLNREWNIDLIPKFIMACGRLVSVLIHTNVACYLEWQLIEESYVYHHVNPGFFSKEKWFHKVPATDIEALKSSLVPLFEKNRCKTFFQFAAKWDSQKKETFLHFNPTVTTMREVYDHFGLQPTTIEFIGHAVALYINDDYIDQPMEETMNRLKLYMYSLSRYGQSPFIYPLYGLGTLPESFSRLCAIHGGTFMLNKAVDSFIYNENGQVCGVKSTDGEIARCKMVICDPTYVLNTDKIKSIDKIIRCICITSQPPSELSNVTSAQIIIPQSQFQRKSDIYVTMISWKHGVAKEGKYIVLVSATIETTNPLAEIEPVLNLIGEIDYKFINISDMYVPTSEDFRDNVFVSKSYDATSHFESAIDDVLNMWEKINGSPLDLSKGAMLPKNL